MTEIRILMDAILGELGYPYYFLQAEEPEKENGIYICYDCYDYNALCGDGRQRRRRVTVTVSVYGRDDEAADEVMERLREKMDENDFCPGGGAWEGDAEFPGYVRRTADFIIDVGG